MNVCDIDCCVLVYHEQQAGRAHTAIVTTNGLIFTWGRYLSLKLACDLLFWPCLPLPRTSAIIDMWIVHMT
jgi:hypothetical protein